MQTTDRTGLSVRPTAPSSLSDADVCDAYLYLLGRFLVLRQEHLDFENEGFKWNKFIHRDPGGVAWANPNLDVAYSEAWIAVDDASSTIVEVPKIVGRYYTVQVLNPWGETIANINERNFPAHPSGPFAFCLKGTRPTLPAGAQRIDLPGKKARVLARVELGADPLEAIALQHRITLRATGAPTVAAPIHIRLFANDKLPGVEVFDDATDILASEPDINPGIDALQTKVRAVAIAAQESAAERARIDHVIKQQAWQKLKEETAAMGDVTNGWIHPKGAGNYGDNWLMRTIANLTGIWANNQAEVVYFGAGQATPLDGSDTRAMTFAKNDLPESRVRYFWSVICVDAVDFRVTPNAENRFLLNSQSKIELGKDGSLTLYFAPEKPRDAADGNWLPTPAGQKYVLTWRSYGPDQATVAGKWFPPPLVKR